MRLIANWKQNKNVDEARLWMREATVRFSAEMPIKAELIVAPSFQLIETVNESNADGFFKLAAQDVSQFEGGKHTGEVSAAQLSSLVEYAIIGHSERRSVGDNPEIVNLKIAQCLANKITPIVCFSDAEQFKAISPQSQNEQMIFAYEPLESIGTNNPATKESIVDMKEKTGLKEFIYGGSVDSETVKSYLTLDFIKGFLIGTASLNTDSFYALYQVISL